MFAGARDFSEAIFQEDGGVVGKELPLSSTKSPIRIGEKLFVFPRAFELSDFFFERHAREEIGDALFDRELGVLIGKSALGKSGSDREQGNNQAPENCGQGMKNRAGRFHRKFVILSGAFKIKNEAAYELVER